MWSWLMIGARRVCQTNAAIHIRLGPESKTDHPTGLEFEPRMARMRMETSAAIPLSVKSASSAVSIPLTCYADGRRCAFALPAW
jgi:hypothetical protein